MPSGNCISNEPVNVALLGIDRLSENVPFPSVPTGCVSLGTTEGVSSVAS